MQCEATCTSTHPTKQCEGWIPTRNGLCSFVICLLTELNRSDFVAVASKMRAQLFLYTTIVVVVAKHGADMLPSVHENWSSLEPVAGTTRGLRHNFEAPNSKGEELKLKKLKTSLIYISVVTQNTHET